MQKQKTLIAFFVLIVGIALLNTASAQNFTLIAGKIYTNNYHDTVAGAQVSVACNSYSLSTTSRDDGSYAVGFDPSNMPCLDGAKVDVSATKDRLIGTDSGNVAECDGNETCDADFIAIINVLMKVKDTGSGGGGSGSYYFCGNGKCDAGETATTCPRDCNISKINLTNTPTTSTTTKNETPTNNTPVSLEEPEEDISQQPGSISRITGAVIGALASSPSLTFITLAIAAILVASIVVRLKTKPKSS